ncbi:exopolysaccharide biosynthesis protein [Algicella marina]|uniref:exopolysaccharide biosynthesis protein n=1 Tax=Algicella marina TaxID=2683284 RepID=UPI0024DF47E8|nr:exopolysaccharide biosynthesis protein [Algicella marina]
MSDTEVSRGDDEPHSIGEILERAEDATDSNCVSIRRIVQELGDASFAPLLTLPALIVITPASGIPGLSSVCGICILLIAMQMVVQRDHVWLPDWLMRREVPQQRMQQALQLLKRPARRLDSVLRQRLHPLVEPPLAIVPQLMCVVAGAMMPVLELVPFSSSIIGAGVAVLAVGLVARDGLVILCGVIGILASLGGAIWFLL